MPRIKAYKGAGLLIPVDDAKLCTAYQCPWTGKVYSDKRSYVKHLNVLRVSRSNQRIKMNRQNKLKTELWSKSDFNDIINWLDMHPEVLFDELIGSGREGWSDRRKHLRDDFWFKVTYLDLSYNLSVSNSHNAPHNGVTNWGRRELFNDGTARPTGYPGWEGMIEFKISHELGGGSDILKSTRMHTGTGGGDGIHFGYDVRLFEADWPGLAQYAVMEKLREDNTNWTWGDDPNNWRNFKYGTARRFR